MNFLILGAGAEELAWARALDVSGVDEHEKTDQGPRIVAAYPGFDALPQVRRVGDLDEALALVGVEAVLVGGTIAERGEHLRRVAAVGLPIICLHPPGDDAEAYYQVALSREETGSVVIPNLP